MTETYAVMLPHTIAFNAGAAGPLLDSIHDEILGVLRTAREGRQG